jgi:hypothetical protein
MKTFVLTTDYADCGSDITVTIAVDGRDLAIVAALQDGVVIDTDIVADGHRHTIAVLLLEAAGDYAHDNDLYEEADAYVPERKHWEVREDRFGY